MRISCVSVKDLFGMFKHEVKMNLDERITIIHGVNGVGKTAVLRLIDGVVNRQAEEILSIPFSEFRIDFDNESYLRITKDVFANEKILNEYENGNVTFHWHQNGKRNKVYPSTLVCDPRDLPFPLSFLERTFPEIRRVGSNRWIHTPTSEIMTLEDVLNKFGPRIPESQKYSRIGWPDWYSECIGDVQVRFVKAQRLLVLPGVNHESKYDDRDRKPRYSEAVSAYAMQLVSIIRNNIVESTILAQSLDHTFPQRLISKHRSQETMEKTELLERLQSIEKKRNFLISVGLLDPEKEKIQIPDVDEIDNDDIRRVLSVYVDDTEKKLGVYNELAEKINLLVELINSRFKYKKMQINKEIGFQFKTDNSILLPANLSSGEQHELVLTYELLFQTSKNTIVLIDEPELSLHVGWQIRFLDDIQKIINLAQIDALVATHSPQIINNRWDLTVKLGKIEE